MSDATYMSRDIAALLAPTLGDERATELVHGALESLGLADGDLSGADVVRALEVVGENAGFIGSVARFALARFTLKDANATARLGRSSTSGMRAVKDEELDRAELTDLLAPTLGQEKSDEVVLEALGRLGLPPDTFSMSQALAVLDILALTDGLVGVAARFAKVHLLMRAPKP